MLLYLAMGSFGLPVFSRFSAGIAHLLGPTGGYLIAFPIATYINGLITSRRSSTPLAEYVRVSSGMIAALAVIYVVGVGWLSAFLKRPFLDAFIIGGLPFLPVDILKMVVAIPIAIRLRKELASILSRGG